MLGIGEVTLTLTLVRAAVYQKITMLSWIGTILINSRNERLKSFVRFHSYLKLINLAVECERLPKIPEAGHFFRLCNCIYVEIPPGLLSVLD